MNTTRRDFLMLAGGTLAAESARDEAAEVSAIEDLMREHGVLERTLLIYEEGVRRIERGEEVDPSVFQYAAQLVRTFVEDYHERLEEQHLFPLFVKADRESNLVAVLQKQHHAGRDVTERILSLSSPDKFGKDTSRPDIARWCRAFITMYRPHAAREDTVLFPALHSIVSEKQIGDLGEQFEEQEEKLFGEEGFLRVVDQVADVERQLGIYELDRFTPNLDSKS